MESGRALYSAMLLTPENLICSNWYRRLLAICLVIYALFFTQIVLAAEPEVVSRMEFLEVVGKSIISANEGVEFDVKVEADKQELKEKGTKKEERSAT